MSEIDLVEEELWDHYSGLPNPLWYQYNKNLKNEESDTDDSTDIRDDDTKI
jgi:hypothetical protein